MKKGWLLVNAFVKTHKFDELYNMFLNASQKYDLILEKKTNAQLLCYLSDFSDAPIEKPDFVLFWDKDVRLAKMLEKRGFKLFNCCDAIERCDDKILSYISLLQSKIKMPKTFFSPKTFLKDGFLDYDFIPQNLPFPVIVKEAFGSFGKQVYKADNIDQLIKIISSFENRPFLIQEFIKSSVGKDIRINVVGDKVVACMLRYNENDFRANISNGGKMKKYTPSSAEEEMAIKASKALGLDFGGIDILFGEDEPIFCEANSNAHFKNIYDCTGINVAEHIIEYISKTPNQS